MSAVLWLKDDIRRADHAGWAEAARGGLAAVVYIDRPDDLVPRTARRREQATKLLNALAPGIRAEGIACRRVPGDPAALLPGLCTEFAASGVVAHQETGDALTFRSDRQVAAALRQAGLGWREVAQDGIARGSAPEPAPYLDPSPADSAALRALDAWLDRLPRAHYRRDMWRPGPDRTACSRLSLDLACGALSGERVLHAVAQRLAHETRPWAQAAYVQFRDRLHWRRGFIAAYERNPAGFPAGPMREPRPTDADDLARWYAGETGIPVVDAAMRDLHATGWINFRLRQTVASFALEHLDLDPFQVGVALGRLFDDYVPGIHWPQILLQAGLLVERGPRIVNPVKQGHDLDPDEAWVRTRLPALADVPAGFAHAPWLHDPIRFRPMVDPAVSARAARARYRPQTAPESAQASLF